MPVADNDAFHEAGHATIGVLRGLRLLSVTAQDKPRLFPHCRWDPAQYDELMSQKDSQAGQQAIHDYTMDHAMMCLASQYAEALYGPIDSYPQKEAFHCNYLDAELKRLNTGIFDYFGLARVQQLRTDTSSLVTQYSVAITAVATRLKQVESLDHAQVASIIDANPPVEPANPD